METLQKIQVARFVAFLLFFAGWALKIGILELVGILAFAVIVLIELTHWRELTTFTKVSDIALLIIFGALTAMTFGLL
ncbi:MAG: hypothetical protein IJ710_07035 [Prevotella sp.]|nr:hypothetical protein [Prevotella sp.]